MTNFSRTQRVRQIERMLDRYSCHYHLSIASTNSRYYTILAPDGEEITVRVADHADVYCHTDLTVDPVFDHYLLVKEWVKTHGEKKAAKRSLSYCWIKENKCSLPVNTKAEALANSVENGVLHVLRSGKFVGWVQVV